MFLYPAVVLAWVYFLLRGVRWVWVVTVAVSVLGFAIELVSGSLLRWGSALGVIELSLLLLPASRHYFSEEPDPTVADPV